jgi:protein ImuB
MRRVVSVWLPTWPTDRLRGRQGGSMPPLEAPLVTRTHDGHRMVIATADASAQSLGLCPGMPLAHAQAVVPGLAVIDADAKRDVRALVELAAWCLRYAPMTAASPPDGIWIDATGCAHLHGGEEAMLADIMGRLARAGVTARAAIADTPGAAHAVARHGRQEVTVVLPDGHADAIAMLPVTALRITAGEADGLRRLGLNLVGQLVSVPRGSLARRFGTGVLQRLDQALGHAPEAIQPALPPQAIQHRLAFTEPLMTAEAFSAVISTLVRTVFMHLERTGQGARRLDLFFECVDGGIQVVSARTARPVRDARHLARLLDERIEEVDPGLGIEAMRLVVALAEPLAYAQSAACLTEEGDERADIGMLVDRLENRFGAHRVYRIHPVESDVPERSMMLVPALTGATLLTWPLHSPRPVRLLDPPRSVEAMSLLPDHPPVSFTWRRVRHRVRRADGPERIHGEWWRRDGEVHGIRDYWIVEDEGGRRFWLFRRGDGTDPRTGDLSWFLHGFF